MHFKIQLNVSLQLLVKNRFTLELLVAKPFLHLYENSPPLPKAKQCSGSGQPYSLFLLFWYIHFFNTYFHKWRLLTFQDINLHKDYLKQEVVRHLQMLMLRKQRTCLFIKLTQVWLLRL